MLEQELQRQIIKYLKDQGYYVINVIQAGKRGVPDILACSPTGTFLAVEVKAPGNLSRVTKLQYFNLAEVRKRGGLAFAADSLDCVKEFVFSLQKDLFN